MRPEKNKGEKPSKKRHFSTELLIYIQMLLRFDFHFAGWYRIDGTLTGGLMRGMGRI